MDYFSAKTLMRKVAPKALGEGKATDLLHSCQSNDAIVGVYAEFFTGQYSVYQHKIVLKKKQLELDAPQIIRFSLIIDFILIILVSFEEET